MKEDKVFCTNCGHELNRRDKKCPRCNYNLIDAKKYTIIGIIFALIGAISMMIDIFITKDGGTIFTLIGLFTCAFGFVVEIAALIYSNRLNKSYKTIAICTLIVTVFFGGYPFFIRILDSAGDPCMCSQLDTTINWDVDTESSYPGSTGGE